MFLEFYVFGERVIGWVCVGGGGGGGGGGVRNISSPLRGGGVLNIFRRFWGGGGAKFYGRILEYPPFGIPSTHTL